MTDIPADGLLEDASGDLTTANAKTALEQLRDVEAELPGGAATSELTISGGNITPTKFLHSVDTESDAASDDLDNIVTTNHPESRLLLIYAENAARTVVVKHAAGGAGQIHTADDNDLSLDETDILLCLYRSGTDWYELFRNYGANTSDWRSYYGLGTSAVKDTGVANGNVCMFDATGYPTANGSQITDIASVTQYILVQDIKADGTDGGTFTSAAWRVRDLTDEIIDEPSACTLAANQITLIAGTYRVRVLAPARMVNVHRARFYETTGTITNGNMSSGIILGLSAYSYVSAGGESYSEVLGKFTVTAADVTAGQNVFEVQHIGAMSNTDDGFGKADPWSVGNEYYTLVELWKYNA